MRRFSAMISIVVIIVGTVYSLQKEAAQPEAQPAQKPAEVVTKEGTPDAAPPKTDTTAPDATSATPQEEPASANKPAPDPNVEGFEAGYKAPAFLLGGLDEKEYSLQQWSGEKPVVINFWASWCGPCRYEMPDLVKLEEKYRDDVVFYGVNVTSTDTMPNVLAFVDEYSVKYPILLDERGAVANAYGVIGIPTTFFIDKNGVISDKIVGGANATELEKRIIPLVEKK